MQPDEQFPGDRVAPAERVRLTGRDVARRDPRAPVEQVGRGRVDGYRAVRQDEGEGVGVVVDRDSGAAITQQGASFHGGLVGREDKIG